jgi:hypothetical protein
MKIILFIPPRISHLAHVAASDTQPEPNNMTTTTTYSVLFPLWKGSKTYRQIGITENPAANYRPGVTLRFVDINTNDSFVLTGGGLVKVTE